MKIIETIVKNIDAIKKIIESIVKNLDAIITLSVIVKGLFLKE